MKAIGIVAGLGVLSLLAIGVKRGAPQALAKACHGLMAAKMQEHCGGGQAGAGTACCAAPAGEAQKDPGETGQTKACAEACTEE